MKKLIAISMMFALVAGAVFAQAEFSATLETRMQVLGDTRDGDDGKAQLGTSVADAYIQTSAANDDGTLGGLVRITQNGGPHRAFIWWKPIDQFRFFLGRDDDGLLNGSHHLQAGWGYHRGGEGWLNYHDWGYWRAVFPQNWDSVGAMFSIYPIDGVELNIVLPVGGNALVETQISRIRFNVSAQIGSIGSAHVNYVGPGTAFSDVDDVHGHSGVIGAAFVLQAVEGLDLTIGVSTPLAKDREANNTPIAIGLAGSYAVSGEFTVKFRGAFEVGGILSADKNGTTLGLTRTHMGGDGQYYDGNKNYGFGKGNAFQFSVMPIYNLGSIEARLDVGLRVELPDGGDALVGWFVNPYARVPIPGGRFQFGFRINTARLSTGYAWTADDKDYFQWSIPIGLVFGW